MSSPDESMRVVREPYTTADSRPGEAVAGVGVQATTVVGGEPAVAVCQLWTEGKADPVYVEPADIPELVASLTEAAVQIEADGGEAR